MSKPIIIFGTGQIAEVAYFYFTHDSNYEVVAFTVDEQYLSDKVFFDLPVLAFETVNQHFPVDQYEMFVAISYAKLNKVREHKYKAAKAKGYQLVNYISSKATVWPGLKIGDNCFILEDNTIQPFVTIRNNVTLWSGNHIGHHSIIHDNNFISSHVVISGGVEIEKNCFVGVNATIRDHVHIGRDSIIGMGAVITKNTNERSVYKGAATHPASLMSDQISI